MHSGFCSFAVLLPGLKSKEESKFGVKSSVLRVVLLGEREMALSASQSCTKAVVTGMAVSEPRVSATEGKTEGVLPLPAKPKFQSSALRRTKSRKPVKTTKLSAAVVQEAELSAESVSQVGNEVATTSGEVLNAVVEEGPAAMRVRKSSSKANSRTSRRRALVMCLALGMVRPCASNIAQTNTDLRRTASAMPALRRTESTLFKTPAALISQVSLATTLKQTNLLGEQEDGQKLTTLQ